MLASTLAVNLVPVSSWRLSSVNALFLLEGES